MSERNILLIEDRKLKSKTELRKDILRLRDALTLEEREQKSHEIMEKVVAKKEFIEADNILLYASYKSEVDTTEIFRAACIAGKAVYYPKVIDKEMEFFKVETEVDLIEGYRGIREPKVNFEKQLQPALTNKICAIMPGTVFDEECNRIGYGGGYYDKYLQRLEAELQLKDTDIKDYVYKMALAFECQIVEAGRMISELHDIKVNCIVTEKRII